MLKLIVTGLLIAAALAGGAVQAESIALCSTASTTLGNIVWFRQMVIKNYSPIPQRAADRCGATNITCPGTCCYSTSRGYYCADKDGYC